MFIPKTFFPHTFSPTTFCTTNVYFRNVSSYTSFVLHTFSPTTSRPRNVKSCNFLSNKHFITFLSWKLLVLQLLVFRTFSTTICCLQKFSNERWTGTSAPNLKHSNMQLTAFLEADILAFYLFIYTHLYIHTHTHKYIYIYIYILETFKFADWHGTGYWRFIPMERE